MGGREALRGKPKGPQRTREPVSKNREPPERKGAREKRGGQGICAENLTTGQSIQGYTHVSKEQVS